MAIGEAHGRVTRIGRDPKLHAFCGTKCRCRTVELAMDSAGKDDERSDLGTFWLTAVVRTVVHRVRR